MTRIFSGSLTRMQAQYGLKYLWRLGPTYSVNWWALALTTGLRIPAGGYQKVPEAETGRIHYTGCGALGW